MDREPYIVVSVTITRYAADNTALDSISASCQADADADLEQLGGAFRALAALGRTGVPDSFW